MSSRENTGGRVGRYLTFGLADEAYGLDILRVQEIVGLLPLTRVPRLPSVVAGVVNLRGRVIPVLDLRRSLGMPATELGERNCIIIVRSAGTESTRVTGLIVDEVSDVIDLTAADSEEAPEFGPEVAASFLSGIGRIDGRVVLLLDIDHVLSEVSEHGLESPELVA